MQRIREEMGRRPVAWFFAIAMAAEVLVVAVLLLSGALAELEAAIDAVFGGAQRTDFVLWGIWHFPARPDILLGGYGLGGGALLAILVARFLVLSVVMAYFYNRAGGSTLIAIAMHGLHNDSVGLMGRITGEGLAPYVISELALLAPIAVVASWLLVLTGGRLGLDKPSEERATLEVTPS
jgi:hypothetical protein